MMDNDFRNLLHKYHHISWLCFACKLFDSCKIDGGLVYIANDAAFNDSDYHICQDFVIDICGVK